MKKPVVIVLSLVVLAACGPQRARVERVTDEEGVEVVLNGFEPAPAGARHSSLALEEEMAIDTEDDAVARSGLTDIGLFDADSGGNVYFAGRGPNEESVIKFDSSGRFTAAFARRGQGPGEVQGIRSLLVTPGDDIAIMDSGGNRAAVFGGDGAHLRDIPVNSRTKAVLPLKEDRLIVWDSLANPAPGVLFGYPLNLVDGSLHLLMELDRGILEDPISGERLRGTYHIQSWSVSRDRIYAADQERGYDILCYDWDGKLIRKIRKTYSPVPVPETHKREFLAQFEAPQFQFIRAKIVFPEAMPPFISIMADDAGRLFVMTYEKGIAEGEWIFDVFDTDGVLALRTSVPVRHDSYGMHGRIRNSRLYAVEDKDNGFKVLKVYRMNFR